MTVFHAGSLSAPFGDVEAAIESRTDVRATREAKGSVGSTRKVTDLGRSADVLGVADFRLLRDMVVPEFADWYAVFATNAMAVAYTESSTGADEFSTGNWWEVLARDDVVFGHSDPAVDPNGYRSVMAMQLGATPFEGERLFSPATSRRLREKARIPAGTEVDLISQLESGELDYAWQYSSAAESHGVDVVDLQPEVNMARATPAYADHYATATVRAGGERFTGAPIAYGVTVPSVAENPAAGRRWVRLLAEARGREILAANGLGPVSPMVVPARVADAAPDAVLEHAEVRETLGPLEL
jgi:molybdate/tungstate transport system substrate-binding protein